MDDLEFLQRLLSIPSPSGREDAVALFLIEQMAALGFVVHRDEVGNVVGQIGDLDAEKCIVLLGHLDTVPGHIPVRSEDGRLYGRGAVDAKGPLASLVLAAAGAGPGLEGAKLVVVGAVEEETHSRGAHHLAEMMDAPYCTIIGEPSSWEGITLGYKGTMTVDYRLVQPNQHVAGEGPTPAQQAVAFWNQVTQHAAIVNEGQNRFFNMLDPALRTIRTFNDGLEDGVEMCIGLRLPPGTSVAGLQAELSSWRGKAELSFPYSEQPYRGEKNTPLVRAFLRAIRSKEGKPRFKLKTGTADMNVVGPVWGCPIVAYGPGDSTLDHTPDEHVEIEEFRRSISVLEEVLMFLTA